MSPRENIRLIARAPLQHVNGETGRNCYKAVLTHFIGSFYPLVNFL